MKQESNQTLFLNKVLQGIWEIPADARVAFKISTNFLLKWHVDYLEDKTHLEIKGTEFIPYIYRDKVKFYILSYDKSQPGDSNYFWLSFRKNQDQPHGYVLIKKARG
jgi:hypothetical protein